MRLVGLLFVALSFMPAACGGSEPPPRSPVDNDELAQCFEGTYGDADQNASLSRCEQQHLGSQWRSQPAPAQPDTPQMAGTGNLDARIIQAGIHARLARVRACYRAGVKRNPKLQGEVRIKFAIDTSGRAIRAEDAGSKLQDKKVISCIIGEFSAMRFPRPEGGGFVPVVYPILFAPGDTYR